MSDYIKPVDRLSGFVYRYINYRLKPAKIYKQEVTNARYEDAIRNSSSTIVDKYIYDKIEIVKIHK